MKLSRLRPHTPALIAGKLNWLSVVTSYRPCGPVCSTASFTGFCYNSNYFKKNLRHGRLVFGPNKPETNNRTFTDGMGEAVFASQTRLSRSYKASYNALCVPNSAPTAPAPAVLRPKLFTECNSLFTSSLNLHSGLRRYHAPGPSPGRYTNPLYSMCLVVYSCAYVVLTNTKGRQQ